jgi:transketolase
MAEGSMWEAMEHAAHAGLDNLTAILDVNRLGQTGETMHGWDLDAYVRRAQVAGWNAMAIDGHDVAEIDQAYTDAARTELRPTMIVARTEKGHGVAAVANQNGFHGKALADPEAAIAELGGLRHIRVSVSPPDQTIEIRPRPEPDVVRLPAYEVGTTEATRRAYGEALAAVGTARREVVALDGEVSNSTYAEIFRQAHPDRYFEMYIAEQQMVAAAVGMQVRGWRPFASTFAAFLTRAYDFIRMAAVSRANLSLVGSHAGVSIGEDGPSQMALEDLAMMRAVYGSTVLYPSDANQTAALVAQMVDLPGIVFLRTTREKTPVIYPPGESFPIGGARVVRSSPDDEVTLIGAGITLHQAMAAADALSGEGINARVIDLYSVKPVDTELLREAAAATGRLVTVEDHWPEGGLGDAVLDVFADAPERPRIVKLAVRAMPGSATPAEQLAAAGIDAAAIAAAARDLVAGTAAPVPADVAAR